MHVPDTAMPPLTLVPGRFLKRSRFAVVVAALLLGFCGLTAAMLVQLRAEAWTQAATGADNLLATLSQDIGRNVELYDLSLQSVISGLQLSQLPQLQPEVRQAVLFDGAATAKYLGAILVLNERGDVVEDSGAVPPRHDNFRDRDYFRAQKVRADVGLYISAPFRRRLTGPGDLVVALSRRLSHPDGSFAGVVVGTLRLDYFRDLFGHLRLGKRDAVNLFRTDGVVMMRAPYDESQIGQDLSLTDNIRRFMAAPSGHFIGISAIDGVQRAYTFTHVGSLPLMLDVALSERDIFAAWRVRAAVIGSALLALCGMAGGLAALFSRAMWRSVRAERDTQASEAQYRLLAGNATDVIMRLAPDLARRYVSPASRMVLGYTPEELVGRKPCEIVHADDWPRLSALIEEARGTRSNFEAIYRVRHKAGHPVWVEARYSSVHEDGGFIAVLRDISKRKRAEQELEAAHLELTRLATIDGLTGLANRRSFDDALEWEWRRAGRDGSALSLLLLDVDRFKLFNDRYGHQEGDACLRAVARAVADCVGRPADLVARYGGEEVVVLLLGTEADGAAMLAERVRAAIEALRLPHEGNGAHGGVVTASVGAASVLPAMATPGGIGTLEALVAAADQALYEAKRQGRNRVVERGGMPTSPVPSHPADEEARLQALATYQAVGVATPSESLDRVARLAATLLGTPLAYVSLVERDEQLLVGHYGLDLDRTDRDASFCAHTILGEEPLIVADALEDPRFATNPFVVGGPEIRFYAGAPMRSPQGGHNLGALCVADTSARVPLTAMQRVLLMDLAALAVVDLEGRRLQAKGNSMTPARADDGA